MTINYGAPPIDLGRIDLDPQEMMFYLYLPIKLRCKWEIFENIPKRLAFLEPVMESLLDHIHFCDLVDLWRQYIYITAKTLYVDGTYSGNRPGWHADGFGSNGDLNFIWYNMNPTEFAVQEFGKISIDDKQSIIDMEEQIDYTKVTTYPNEHLLMLDEGVVHRVNPIIRPGVRTFIKISVSEHEFNLKGNSRNYLLDYNFNMYDRDKARNLDCNKDFVK